ncbi:MAG: ATP-binding cassette domain-containing protein [Sphingobacteriales bacterium]|nr:MAG: ATP-binding cassette domain-containing protein [Sphingobacteriales bacterium]
MQISLSDTGKRFNRDWIFRNFSYQFTSGGTYAITGANGSGKSTLLQVIAGAVVTSEGTVSYNSAGKPVEGDKAFRYLSIAAPYQELIEEMTLTEFLTFHQKFKPLLKGYSIGQIAETVKLDVSSEKQIRYYSSGMKQRAKLAQAFFSDTPVLLLDEPCTNLDQDGTTLYQKLIEDLSPGRTVIVSSNDVAEYGFCKERISMSDIKRR